MKKEQFDELESELKELRLEDRVLTTFYSVLVVSAIWISSLYSVVDYKFSEGQKQGIELTKKIYNIQGGNEALRSSSFDDFYRK